MDQLNRDRSIELEEDLEFERREWRTARITWIALLALMAATLAGLFGGGPLSRARAADPSGALRIEYPRFIRYGASLRLMVQVRAGAGGRVALTLGPSLVRAYRVEQITPAPVRSEAAGNAVEYVFDIDAGGPAATVIFDLQSRQRWLLRGAIHAGGRSVTLTQFVYP